MNYGFVKVAAAVPTIKVADCGHNAMQIESLILQAAGKGAEVICFPELSLTSYSCADLFLQSQLLESCENSLFHLLDVTRSLDIIAIIGMPVRVKSLLFDCAVAIQKGKILGIVPKTCLANHDLNSEKRWFATGESLHNSTTTLCGQTVSIGIDLLFDATSFCFGMEIGTDLWAAMPQSTTLCLGGADIIFNLSATLEIVNRNHFISSMMKEQSIRCISGYVYASSGWGESTSEGVYAGNAMIWENGKLLSQGERFLMKEQMVISEIDVDYIRSARQQNSLFSDQSQRFADYDFCICKTISTIYNDEIQLTRPVCPTPFIPEETEKEERFNDILNIQTTALARRLTHTGSKTLVIGISGGLDSTLALLVCVKTMDMLNMSRKAVIAITMPGFGTTDRTYNNALALMNELGVSIREISIKDACIQHFKDIEQDMSNHDVTYENSQARERTQILMDVANKENGLVVGTGDLSELALGWCTYNGDQMSNYSVNCSIPKTLVQHLVRWIAQTQMDEQSKATLLDIVDTPISPELTPADEQGNIKQKTEDLVGPYELHDFFIYHFIRNHFTPAKILFIAKQALKEKYDDETLTKWHKNFFRRFFIQQFKRSCSPDGPKIGSVGLGCKGEWIMPSDASFTEFIIKE